MHRQRVAPSLLLVVSLFVPLLHTCFAQQCYSDSQCLPGQMCAQVGLPTGGIGYQCIYRNGVGSTGGSVRTPCINGYQCPSGQQCVNNVCMISVGGVVGGGIGNPGSGSGSSCNRDSDCRTGETCVNLNGINRCQLSVGGVIGGGYCRSDVDCPTNQHCVGNRCQSTAGIGSQCFANYQCSNGAVCVNGFCQSSSSGRSCSYDADCPLNQRCVLVGNVRQCQSSFGNNGQCTSDSNCNYDEKCVNGFCSGSRQCVINSECMVGEICKYEATLGKSICERDSSSGQSCHYDFECPGGQVCTQVGNQLQCQSSPNGGGSQPCLYDADCPYGLRCVYQGPGSYQCVRSTKKLASNGRNRRSTDKKQLIVPPFVGPPVFGPNADDEYNGWYRDNGQYLVGPYFQRPFIDPPVQPPTATDPVVPAMPLKEPRQQ